MAPPAYTRQTLLTNTPSPFPAPVLCLHLNFIIVLKILCRREWTSRASLYRLEKNGNPSSPRSTYRGALSFLSPAPCPSLPLADTTKTKAIRLQAAARGAILLINSAEEARAGGGGRATQLGTRSPGRGRTPTAAEPRATETATRATSPRGTVSLGGRVAASTCVKMHVGSDHTPTPAQSEAALPTLAPPGRKERPRAAIKRGEGAPKPSELGVWTRCPEQPD